MNLLFGILLLITSGCAETRQVSFTVLHTNDIHAQVLPENNEGGLARVATLIRQIRSQEKHVLYLDAGDNLHGSLEEYLSKGEAFYTTLNKIRPDVVTFGNHEFDFGQSAIAKDLDFMKFPVVAANLRDRATGLSWKGIKEYEIFEFDGIRVAVLGLMTPETLDLQWPAWVNEIQVENPSDVAARWVPELRKMAHFVIVLSHLGFSKDCLLAAKVPGIDLIVGGHSHTALKRGFWVKETLITQTGAYGRALGRIPLNVKVLEDGKIEWTPPADALPRDNREDPASLASLLIPISPAIVPDPETTSAYLPFREKKISILSEEIAESPRGVSGAAKPFDPSPATQVAADGIRFATHADISLIDPSSVSPAGIPQGRLNVGHAFNLIQGYTRQNLVTVKILGADLKRAIENRLARNFKKITTVPSGASFDVKYLLNKVEIDHFQVGAQPLDPSRFYVVSSQSYAVMEDFLLPTIQSQILTEHSFTTREAQVDYFREKKVILTPEKMNLVVLQRPAPESTPTPELTPEPLSTPLPASVPLI